MFEKRFQLFISFLGIALVNCRFFYVFKDNEDSLSQILNEEIKKAKHLPFKVIEKSFVDLAVQLSSGKVAFVEVKRGELEDSRVKHKYSKSPYLQTFGQKGLRALVGEKELLDHVRGTGLVSSGYSFLRGYVDDNGLRKKIAVHCEEDPFAQVLEYRWFHNEKNCSTYVLLYFAEVKESEEERLITFSLYQVEEKEIVPLDISFEGKTLQTEQVKFDWKPVWDVCISVREQL